MEKLSTASTLQILLGDLKCSSRALKLSVGN
jgi:hypothetical protein